MKLHHIAKHMSHSVTHTNMKKGRKKTLKSEWKIMFVFEGDVFNIFVKHVAGEVMDESSNNVFLFSENCTLEMKMFPLSFMIQSWRTVVSISGQNLCTYFLVSLFLLVVSKHVRSIEKKTIALVRDAFAIHKEKKKPIFVFIWEINIKIIYHEIWYNVINIIQIKQYRMVVCVVICYVDALSGAFHMLWL